MADASQTLKIKLTGDSAGARAEIGATERDLKRLPDAAAAVNKESRAAAGGLRELAGSVAALVGGGLAVEQFIAANREASRLRASLNVLTGDAQTTAAVWRTLQAEFGASIGVEAAAAAFQKLKALGLSAGTETIRSYSNTAAAMGKSTQDFVEAVADAVTGEFERLKEFGIKAAANGDKVKLTFQGVTTEISNSAAAIEQYLVSIGTHQFGGALAEQAKTLDGAFSRAGNSARQFWQALGDTGAAAALAAGLNAGADAVDALRQKIGDGALFAGLAESAEQSGAVAAQSIESLGVSIEGVQYAATETGRVIAEAIPEGVRFAAEALAELPLNLRTITGIMLGELDKFGADANAVWENVKLGASIAWSATTNVVIESTDRMRRALSGVAESAARALAGALGVEGASFGFEGGVGDRTTDRTQEFEQRRAQIAAERKSRQDAADAAVAGFLRERDAARTAAAEQAALAEGDRRRSRALRDASDRERFHAAAVAATGDAAASAGKKAADGAKKAAAEQKKFAEELARTVAAVDPVAGAVARYSEQVGTLDAALAKGLITQQRHDALVRDAALDYRDRVDVVGAYIRKLEQENQLLGLNGTERDQARAVLEAETAARRAGLEVTDAQREAIRGLVAEQEQLRSQVEPLAKLYERAAEQIYQSWSTLWEDLFTGGIKSMKDFGRQAVDYLRRLLGQLAAQALARPVLVPVITALGGTLGMSQGAIGGTLTQLGLGGGTTSTDGGGFGIGNLSSLSNLFGGNGVGSTLGGLLGAGQIGAYGAGATAGGGGLSFTGASSFGYGAAGGGSALGNAAAGLSNLAYGAAGLGGGLLGHWIAPASPYGSLAGSIGGVAGMVGGEAIGTAAGVAAGAAYGSVIPVVGTIIGAVLGGLIAKFSGDSKPDSSWFRVTSGSRSGRDAKYAPLAEAQTAFGSVAVSGWEDLPGKMQKEFSAGIVQAFSQTDAALAAQLGTKYVDIARQAIDGQALASARQLASKDPSAQVLAIFRARYGAIFGAIDGDLAAAFGRQSLATDNVGQVVAELGELFSVTHQAAQAATLGPYTQQLQALDAQFGRLSVNAQKYGYLVAEVAGASAAAHTRLTEAFNTDVATQIRQITDPTGVALDQLDQAFAVIRADAAAVGGDLAQVEQLYGLRRTEVLREQLAEQQRLAEEAAAEQQRLAESMADIELRRQAALTQILGDPAQTAQYEANRRAVEAARALAAAQTEQERTALAAVLALEDQAAATQAAVQAAADAVAEQRRHASVLADLGLRRLQAQAGISGTDADRAYADGMARQVARLRELGEAANDGERAVLAQVQAMEEQARVATAAREALAAAAAEQRRLTASLEDITGRRLSAIAELSPADTVKAYAAADYKTGIERARELAAAQTDIERVRLREVYAIEDQVTAMQRQQAAADAAAKAEADRQAKITDARNAYIAALQREQSTLQQTHDRFANLADGLGKYHDSLLVGDLSPLDYTAQLAEAHRQFADVSTRARLGDFGALDSLQGAAQTLLEESRAYNASSSDYAADFATVTDALAGAESLSVRQAQIAQDQLDALNAQLQALGVVEGNTQSLADAQAAYLAAIAGQTQQQQTQHQETLTELQALVRVQATANQQLLDRLAALEARLAGMEAAARRSAAA